MSSPQLVELPGFLVAGISIMTTNQDMRSAKDIGALWQRFFGEKIAEQIVGRLGEDLLCLYTDYEEQDRGSYCTLLGSKVNSLDGQPPGISGLRVPPLKYRVYMSEGDLSRTVFDTWTRIWKEGLKRSFVADFDLYPASPDADGERRAYTYVSF